MIKGSKLIGRPVVDMEGAQRLGKIKEIIVQRDGERVAGFIVSHGETIVGTGGTRRLIPASAMHAIGPDAVTVRAAATTEKSIDALDDLPRMCDVVGHKMVTRSGRLLGAIDDVLINGADGRIVGYAVGGSMRDKLENIFRSERSQVRGYIRADADLQVGNDLVVVPDDALVEGEVEVEQKASKVVSKNSGDAVASPEWTAVDEQDGPRRSIWTKRPEFSDQPATERQRQVATNRSPVETTGPAEADKRVSEAADR